MNLFELPPVRVSADMALFVIADLHLSLGADKPMDVFPGWNDYVQRLEKNWNSLIKPEDTVVIAGDISWAMNLEDALEDFAFIHSLPGEKIIMKGNHDYWWSTRNKADSFFAAHGFTSLRILHNCAYRVGERALCVPGAGSTIPNRRRIEKSSCGNPGGCSLPLRKEKSWEGS